MCLNMATDGPARRRLLTRVYGEENDRFARLLHLRQGRAC
jgi:hypothetical protein